MIETVWVLKEFEMWGKPEILAICATHDIAFEKLKQYTDVTNLDAPDNERRGGYDYYVYEIVCRGRAFSTRYIIEEVELVSFV